MNSLKNIALIALDLDDTTLCSSSLLDDKTRHAIQAAIAAGIEVVIASGRAFRSLPKSVTEIPGIHYAITSNGAAIDCVPSGRRELSLTLSAETVYEVLGLFDENMFECFIEGQAYCDTAYLADPLGFGCSPAYVDYVKTTRLPVDDMPSFIAENAHRLDSIDVLCARPEEKPALWDKALALNGAYVTSSGSRHIEISAAGSGKGAALRRLCRMLNIPAEQTAAFGNAENDADMLSFAGLGVAVGNAVDGCKAAADMICPTNNELGVAKTIHMILAAKGCIRLAKAEDIDAIEAIYGRILDEQEAGRAHIGWIRGVYPVRETALAAFERGDLFVWDEDNVIKAAAIINAAQVDVYEGAAWKFDAPDDKVLVLHTLTVDPLCSGQGIGTGFVRFYEALASARSCTALRMDTNAINLAARRLYASLGYREADIVPCVFNAIPDVQLVLLEKSL